MNELTVEFLERPIEGRPVRIRYQGREDYTAKVTHVQPHPTWPNTWRIWTEAGVICVGSLAAARPETPPPPAAPQPAAPTPPQAMPPEPPAKKAFGGQIGSQSCGLGCLAVIVIFVILSAIGSTIPDSPSTPGVGSGSGSGAGTTPTRVSDDLELMTWSYSGQHVTGSIRNNTRRTYSYAQVQINVYDSNGAQIGSTMDNINNLAPGGIWKFDAYVFEENGSKVSVEDICGW